MNALTEPSSTHLRRAIAARHRRAEVLCVTELLEELKTRAPDAERVASQARELVTAVRAQRQGASGVDNLMHEFSLSSPEGIALMCVAEALLRIPDAGTADRLIRDKIGRGDWSAHLGEGRSLFVNAASWGLALTGHLVSINAEPELGNALTRVIARCGEPVIRKAMQVAMQRMGHQFVIGRTMDQALAVSRSREARGYAYSYDMLGEAATTTADAERYTRDYLSAIHAIGRASAGRGVQGGPGISVKLSALHPRYSRAQHERVMAELLPRLKSVLVLAKQYDIGVNIDAEEADRLELSLDLVEALIRDPDLAGWTGLGIVVQAYQKRCPAVIDYLIELARENEREIMIRLVKGAYWDYEVKRAQQEGFSDYPVYTRKAHSDLSYLACAARLLDAAPLVYPQFATHNAQTLAAVHAMADERGVERYEFQCLHGMGEPLYNNVVGPRNLGKTSRVYAPVGSYETLLPYLVRRLLENGSNNSFVNRIVDESVAVDELIENPIDIVRRDGPLPHPLIALPPELFGASRSNSAGRDLADEGTLEATRSALTELAERRWVAAPLIAGRPSAGDAGRHISNPARHSEPVGTVREATPEDVEAALTAAQEQGSAWTAMPPAERAAILRRAADLLEAHSDELMSLCMREAGKTWPNAVGEVREAVDFCRYYAAQIKRLDASSGGVVVAISPWNFPLAIFLGEVSAALAAGHPVIAKPAEQTPLIAHFAVSLLHEAGVPRAALQLLPGRGETVGAALTADPRVGGVIFTGSTEVAREINRSLAGREAMLIAETGGQNAMIVDSSALAEQVVQDVIASGFDSAGQRCSALRILCLQQDVAPRILPMLREAICELKLGDPACLSTDVGPVIDEPALARLQAHVERLRRTGRRIFQLPLPNEAREGCFMPPTLIEIDSLADLPDEVFGPIVHVLSFDASRLDALVDAINSTGYGLTFGIHSRIDETIDRVVATIRAGNVYVNRNIVGAVVGVQPFGGEGLSGTGPKAGGPLYLPRLLGTAVVRPEALGVSGAPAANEALDLFLAWAKSEGKTELVASGQAYSKTSLAGLTLTLPGPTGERNTERFAPRGKLLCVAEDEAALSEQIAACLASGNQALLAPSEAATALLARLPHGLCAAIRPCPDIEAANPAAALFAGTPTEGDSLRRRLAGRDGALIPVIAATPESGRYPLHRLVVERSLCVNTTAAGGNTSLMMLKA
ncbi:bifunctional proline dehydrogenase/L-glutamate gamma-semialdehyde dehydrogenase PutA [Niveibacterium terrae]|uniref:bifunctional proline dehydrogenase/L-glutamate gamma-semialdehyde dehydrogenase PutA n=1 Tax=Niveibacterium terrae TaxID=3373598 RepID=UPI003A90EA66